MIGYRINHNRFKWNYLALASASLTMTSCVTLICNTLLFLSSPANDYLASMFFKSCVCNIMLGMSVNSILFLQFYFLLSLRMRYRLLNVALRRAFDGIPKAVSHLQQSSSDEVIDLLNIISVQHDQLTDGVSIVNKCYSFQVRFTNDLLHFILMIMSKIDQISVFISQILSYLLCGFTNVVFDLFEIFRLLNTDTYVEHTQLVSYLIHSFYTVSCLLMIIYIATATCREVDIHHK